MAESHRNLAGFVIEKLTDMVARADYWKSQEKKYCDFCKCWIADNKPSRDFHENGKRHKENVKKRLKSITKDSAKAQRADEKADQYIRQMEAAALEAYRKDVERNADLTSRAINEKLQQENLAISEGSSGKKVWHQLVSKDGETYYWNTITNETKWEAPEEGFLSPKEQLEEKDKQTAQQLKEIDKHRKKEALLRVREEEKIYEEERAKIAREKLKERRVKEPTPPPVYGPLFDTRKRDAYGTWEAIKESETIDLQLPQTGEYIECPIVYEPEPTVKEFKEKTVASTSKEESIINFKKRKIPTSTKRNMRQRLDDD